MSSGTGVIWIHSTPSALCPHIEWAVGGVLGVPVNFEWTPQPADRSQRAEYAWRGPAGSAAAISSALSRWGRVRFEVTEEASADAEGERYAYTPSLGVFRATTGEFGDVMVHEDRIKAAMLEDAAGGEPLRVALDKLLGRPWDDELEAFRHAGEDAPVRWLHKVV